MARRPSPRRAGRLSRAGNAASVRPSRRWRRAVVQQAPRACLLAEMPSTRQKPPAGSTLRTRRGCVSSWEPAHSRTVEADHLLRIRQLAPVMDQEAAHAGEFVLLLGLHLDCELLVRQVRTRKLEGLCGFRLVLVDLAGVLVVAASLQLFDALFGLVFVTLAGRVVVRRHVSHSSRPFPCCACQAPSCRAFRAIGRGGLCTIGPASDTPTTDARNEHQVTMLYSARQEDRPARYPA